MECRTATLMLYLSMMLKYQFGCTILVGFLAFFRSNYNGY